MKKKKSFIMMLMLGCVLAVLGGSEFVSRAAELDTPMLEIPEEPMESISSYGIDLTIDTSGKATVTGFVRGKPGVDNAYVKVTLQKKTNGSWSSLKSWDAQGGRNATVSGTYTVEHGTYRARIYCSAGNETKIFNSSNKSF